MLLLLGLKSKIGLKEVRVGRVTGATLECRRMSGSHTHTTRTRKRVWVRAVVEGRIRRRRWGRRERGARCGGGGRVGRERGRQDERNERLVRMRMLGWLGDGRGRRCKQAEQSRSRVGERFTDGETETEASLPFPFPPKKAQNYTSCTTHRSSLSLALSLSLPRTLPHQ